MKRLVEVTGNEELRKGLELQQEYKDSKRKLEKHVKSLRNYKGINKDVKAQVEQFVGGMEAVLRFKVDKVVKRSALDFYSIETENVIVGLVSHFKFLSETCSNTIAKARQLKQKAQQTLQQTEKVFQQKSQSHQKMVKQYVQAVYPDTKGLLFKLHFKSGQKFPKKQDPSKQQQMLKQSTLYNNLLQDCINTYEDLRRQLEECGENGLINFRDTWIKSAEELNQELAKIEVDHDEVENFVEGLGKNTERDRSRSRSRSERRSIG